MKEVLNTKPAHEFLSYKPESLNGKNILITGASAVYLISSAGSTHLCQLMDLLVVNRDDPLGTPVYYARATKNIYSEELDEKHGNK